MRPPESPMTLTDGAWVLRGVTKVWRQNPAFDEWVRSLLACPCGATIAEPCDHPERLVSRRCPCGELPTGADGYCSFTCRDRAAQERVLRAREAAA